MKKHRLLTILLAGVMTFTILSPNELSLVSSAESITTENNEKLRAPFYFKAEKKTDKTVTLAWNTTEDADAYRIYKYDSGTKKFKAYKTVKQGEKAGKSREQITAELRENFGEKNPDVRV